MKIFQVITVSEYGGAQSVVANLVKNLSPNQEVYILYGGNGEAWNNLGHNFTRIKLNEHRKDISFKDIGLFFKLLYYRFKYKPDIVHLHSSKMGVLGRLTFPAKKVIITMHGFDSARKAYRKYLFIEKLLKNRASRIIAVSQYDVDAMKEEGISKNVTKIYNGVPDVFTESFDASKLIVEKLKIIKQTYNKTIICISRISKQKKFELFIDIAKKMPEHAFVWIGNKNEVSNVPCNVFCLGEVSSAQYYLKYADLFILPSNYEGLPISLLEALSFGVPVVASSVGGITEVLDDKNGFAVDNTVDAFKHKINYILSDEHRTKVMSQYARESYLANFTIKKMTDKYLSVYNEIVNKQK